MIRRFDRPSKGEVRASAKQMRLVTSTQREGPWEREWGDFSPSLRPLRALLSFEKKRGVWEQGRVHGARFLRPDWTHISLLLVACFWTRMKSVNRQEILKKKKHPAFLTSPLLNSPTKYLLMESDVFTGSVKLRSCCIHLSFYSRNFTETLNQIVAAVATSCMNHRHFATFRLSNL